MCNLQLNIKLKCFQVVNVTHSQASHLIIKSGLNDITYHCCCGYSCDVDSSIHLSKTLKTIMHNGAHTRTINKNELDNFAGVDHFHLHSCLFSLCLSCEPSCQSLFVSGANCKTPEPGYKHANLAD